VTDQPAVRCSAVTLRFGEVVALNEVSFEVQAGEFFAVIGPNGAGKSSLFNILSGIYRPTTGTAWVQGRDLRRVRPRELASLGVARSFQNVGLFPHLSALENVLVGRHHLMRSGVIAGGVFAGPARREEAIHRAAALEALTYVGAAAHAKTSAGLLPYGLQKRVELARCLAMEPSLLLLDEPVAGMSEDERAEITRLVRRMHTEHGFTVLLVEHDMGVVMRLAERVLVLDFGQTLAEGKPEEIQTNEAVIRAYLGAEPELVT
jgi:branched-chain amino acid transport system ATP-binding protein